MKTMNDLKKKIPEERLSNYGISIRLNRILKFQEYKSARYNQKNICLDICSEKSYINIEKGKIARNLNVYVELAQRLDLHVSYYIKLEERLVNECSLLHEYIEFCDFKQIEKSCKTLIEMLEPIKNDLWYCDVYRSVLQIQNYYNDCKYIENEKINYFIGVLSILPIKLADVMQFIIYKTAYDKLEADDFQKVYEQLDLMENQFICNRINLLSYYFANDETSQVLALIKELEEECKKKKNYVRLADIYQFALSYSSCFDGGKVNGYIEALLSLMQEHPFQNKKQAECYYTLGLVLFELNDYEKALEIFQLCDQYDEDALKFQFIFIATCQNRLNKNLKLRKYTKQQLDCFPQDIKNIYIYFNMKDEPEFVRQKFLMDEILPYLLDRDELIINIIKQELTNLTNITSVYKDLMVYNRKEEELLRKK